MKVDSTDEEWWIAYLKDAPEKVFQDLLGYYSNKRRLWNERKIRMTKRDLSELRAFQKAVARLGVDEKTFLEAAHQGTKD